MCETGNGFTLDIFSYHCLYKQYHDIYLLNFVVSTAKRVRYLFNLFLDCKLIFLNLVKIFEKLPLQTNDFILRGTRNLSFLIIKLWVGTP